MVCGEGGGCTTNKCLSRLCLSHKKRLLLLQEHGDAVVALKPRLLYLSPVVPDVTGNGLAMRAGVVLEVLAQRYCLYLLVIPLYPPFGVPVPAPIARLCHQAVVQPVGLPGQARASRPLRRRLEHILG